jgi:hypothetical protein
VIADCLECGMRTEKRSVVRGPLSVARAGLLKMDVP